jgi:hypothetical protein
LEGAAEEGSTGGTSWEGALAGAKLEDELLVEGTLADELLEDGPLVDDPASTSMLSCACRGTLAGRTS